MRDYLYLGQCTKPHGIKGGFHFRLENEEDSGLSVGMEILLTPKSGNSSLPKEGKIYRLSQLSFGHKVMAYLEGVEDRNRVEEMLPFEIFADRDHLPELAEDEFFLSDLIGLQAFETETERALGKVEDFYENGAQVILKVGRDSQAHEIPYVEHFVKELDLQARKIWVLVPEVME